jgi:hypothetical protein
MPDRIAVAQKRAIAEERLRIAVSAAAKAFGVTFNAPAVPRSKYPDLYAAQLVEGVAEFIEQVTQLERSTSP